MKIAPYDTNFTDAQWAYLQPLLPKPPNAAGPPWIGGAAFLKKAPLE